MKIFGYRPQAGRGLHPGTERAEGSMHQKEASLEDSGRGLRLPCPGGEAGDRMPERRADRLEAIEKEVSGGTYRIDSRKIARRLMEQAYGRSFPGSGCYTARRG